MWSPDAPTQHVCRRRSHPKTHARTRPEPNRTKPNHGQQTGLLKPSRAEHELFIRATNLIETALARAAGELKHDKYLGDADWNVVFRYVGLG